MLWVFVEWEGCPYVGLLAFSGARWVGPWGTWFQGTGVWCLVLVWEGRPYVGLLAYSGARCVYSGSKGL